MLAATLTVAAALATAPHGAAAAPGAELTRTAGTTQATLVYRRLQHFGPGDDYFSDARVRIGRSGQSVFAERVPLHPRRAPGEPGARRHRTFVVARPRRRRRARGDARARLGRRALLRLDCASTAGAPLTGTYVPAAHFWGNTSSRPTVADLDGDDRPELVSTDDRFAYDFNGYAGSVRPIQIWSYARGGFRDVTRRHRDEVRRDAARLWRLYVADRRALPGSARGVLPAWAAELYLLGERARADRGLRNAARPGYLLPAVDGLRDPGGVRRGGSAAAAAHGYAG